MRLKKQPPDMNRFLNGGKIMAFGNSKDLFVGKGKTAILVLVPVSKQTKTGHQTTAWILTIKSRS